MSVNLFPQIIIRSFRFDCNIRRKSLLYLQFGSYRKPSLQKIAVYQRSNFWWQRVRLVVRVWHKMGLSWVFQKVTSGPFVKELLSFDASWRLNTPFNLWRQFSPVHTFITRFFTMHFNFKLISCLWFSEYYFPWVDVCRLPATDNPNFVWWCVMWSGQISTAWTLGSKKFSLEQATKAQRVSRGIALPFHYLGA